MSRESEARDAARAAVPHTGRTFADAEAEAARIKAEGIPPTEGDSPAGQE